MAETNPQESLIQKMKPKRTIKVEDLGKLELVAVGELKLNKDGTFNLETINSYLDQHNLELKIKYFKKEDKYAFTIYKTPQVLIDALNKFYQEMDFKIEEVLNTSKPKPKYKPKSNSKYKSDDDYKIR